MTTNLRVFLPVILALVLCAGAQSAQAQGQVAFVNNTNSRVMNCLTGAPVTNGVAFRAALYYAPDGVIDEGSFVQIGSFTTFSQPGVYNGGNRSIPGPAGTAYMFQVRVWEAAYGATFEAALAAGPINCRRPILGKSLIVRAITSVAPNPPTQLNIPGFSVCPDPCVGVSCPSDIVVITNNPSGAAVTYTVGSTNVCCPASTNTVVNCSPPSGSVFPPGTNVVNCTVTDGIGPSNTCFFLVVIRVPTTHYASLTGGHTYPFTNWAGAATNIQAAVDASYDGDSILVTNGTYRLRTNVFITKALSLRSVNGSAVTLVDGQNTNRCVFASNPLAVIDGFTIRNGRAVQSTNDTGDGGGIYLLGGVMQNCVVSNCIADIFASGRGGGVYMIGGIISNSLVLNNGSGRGQHFGGGVYCVSTGRIDQCQIRGNATEYWGGGVYMVDSVLTRSWISDGLAGDFGGGIYAIRSSVADCVISNNIVSGEFSYGPDGGGVHLSSSDLDRCIVVTNTAGVAGRGGQGGGIYCTNGTVRNSLIVGNRSRNLSSPGYGGGVFLKSSSLHSSTVSQNLSEQGGGAVYMETSGTVANSISYFNGGATNVNWIYTAGTFTHVCTTPNPGGVGNITSNPSFVNTNAFNYHLSAVSPCIDAGTNQSWMVGAIDLDGSPRIINGRVDIGAYESGCLPPLVVLQPVSQTNCAFSTTSFIVSTSGSQPQFYQWQFNTTNLTDGPRVGGATSTSLSIYNLTLADAGNYRVLITNSCGVGTSTVASLTVRALPAVGLNPLSQTNCAGGAATFLATASGSGPLTVRWQKDGADLVNDARVSGATTTNLLITGLLASDAGNYSLFVSNSCGTTNSFIAALTVRTPPTVPNPYLSIKRNVGTNLAFTITPGGSLPRSVQWRFNGLNMVDGGRVLGVHTTVLTIANAQPSDSGTYSTFVSNSCGFVTANIADVIVADCPQITLQPIGATQCAGSTAFFRTAMSGTPPFAVRWYFNGAALIDDGRIAGAFTTNLVISDLQVTNAGTYYALVTNACGFTTSIQVDLVVLTPPEITVQPLSQVAYDGQTVTFVSAAISSLAKYYQWRFNGVALPSQTNVVLTISNVNTARAGDYTVVVTNSCGATTSVVATLAVPDCLSIAANPVSQEATLDSSVTFSVAPSGAGPFGYQWSFNGAPLNDGVLISGGAGPQLRILAVGYEHFGDYTVVISNFCGSVTSAPAALTLKEAFVSETAPPNIGDLRLARAGILNAVVLQPDGRIIVGGMFSSISGVPRNNLARLNPDGSVDATWDARMAGMSVHALTLNGTDLFVAGTFWRIGGEFRNGLAKLSTLNGGEAAPFWNPNVSPDSRVDAIAVAGTNIFVGGVFTSIGGQPRSSLAKLSAGGTGAADPIWQADIDFFGAVRALAVAGGQLYVGGSFSSVRGEARANLARVALSGGGVVDGLWHPEPDDQVKALAVSGSELFAGGAFSTIAGASRTGMAKFQIGSGLLDGQWTGANAGLVSAIAVRGTNVYVAAADGLLKLRATGVGTQDLSWKANLLFETNAPTINAVAATDAAVFAGGYLTDASGVVSAGLARLNVFNGGRVPGFNAQLELPGTVFAIARQADGRVIIGGSFLFAGGSVRRNLARVNLDATVDSTWKPPVQGAGDVLDGSSVRALAIVGTDLFVGGWFGKVGTNNQSYLAKVDVGGSDAVDANWKPSLNGTVFSIVATGSNVFVGGEFDEVNGQKREGVCKLSARGNGALDTNWNAKLSAADFTAVVFALALKEPDLYIGGRFQYAQDFTIPYAVRVSSSGTGLVDEHWRTWLDDDVLAMAFAGTNLYLGGRFTSSGVEQEHWYIAKVADETNGALDDDWQPNPDQPVWALAAAGDDVYAGGAFTRIGDETRSYVAKVRGPGRGELDSDWQHQAFYDPDIYTVSDTGVMALLANGADVHVGGHFTEVDGVRRVGYVFLPVPDAPTMFVSTNSTIVIQRNAADGAEITGFRITEIVGGDLFHGDGTTQVHEGEWVTVAEGAGGLKFVGTNDGPQTVTAVSAFNQTPAATGTAAGTVDVGVGGVPAFSFSRLNYEVVENVDPALVEVTVVKRNFGAASVSFVWIPVTARPYAHHEGDFAMLGNVTTFNFGADQTSTNIEFFIYNDDVREGDEQFVVTLVSSSPGSVIVEPRDAVVTILDDECTGAQGSSMVTQPPTPLPPLTGGLQLNLDPRAGQWRLAGDPLWRASGETASGLGGGVYEVGFRPLTAGALLGNMFFQVNEGETTVPPDIQYPIRAATGIGTLRVDIFPAEVGPAAQWQPAGYPQFFPSGTVETLEAGTYELRFTPVAGWNPPRDLFASVTPGFDSVLVARYARAETVSNQKPLPLSLSQVLNEAPYYYNGLIETEVPSESGTQLRFGSGVVVKQRVVLTAAHVLFDEANLTFVSQARWYLQKQRGEYEPRPQLPQGWYIRAGYDAARQAEASAATGGTASRSLDVAAMFFEGADNLPGRGGFGGFVASDNDGNEWLLSTREKMLVGYPLDPNDVPNHGKMHATAKVMSAFQLLQRRVYANADLQSFPGNSGGPLYVKADDGHFFPAAVYLGGSGQVVVRAIDKDVVCLINSAEQTGSGGGHHVGGGVALWEVGDTSKIFTPGLFGVTIEPPAITNQARWHVARSITDSSADYRSGDLIYPTEAGQFTVAFTPIDGWGTPTNRLGIAFKNQINRMTVEYVPLVLKYAVVTNLARQIVDIRFFVQGAPGRRYNVHVATNLPDWFMLGPVTNGVGATQFFEPLPRPERRFFRVKEYNGP